MNRKNYTFSRSTKSKKYRHARISEGFSGWPTVFLYLSTIIIFLLGIAGAWREFF